MRIKPFAQEYIQEDPSLKAPQAHPSVPTTPSLIQTPLSASLHAPGFLHRAQPHGLMPPCRAMPP